MRQWLLVGAAAFGIALAVVVGVRLERASLAVVVGVVCGILAGLPVSGALMYLYWRERQERLQTEERDWRGMEQRAAIQQQAPPVVILNAGRGAEMMPPRPLLGTPAEREFTIIGQEEGGKC